MKDILIFAPGDDVHARIVKHRIDQLDGCRGWLVDSLTFPIGSSLDYSPTSPDQAILGLVEGLPGMYGSNAEDILLRRKTEADLISLANVPAVWWRRPRGHLISKDISEQRFRGYAAANTRAAIEGWLAMAGAMGIRVVNTPDDENRASQKALQLYVAKQLGMNVPETLFGSDHEEIRRWVKGQNKAGYEVIFKPLAPSRGAYQSTQVLHEEHQKLLDKARYCPTIFQQRIKGSDIRAIVIGSRVFALEEKAVCPEGEVDIRTDFNTQASPIELPEELVTKILDTNERLGLNFGAYDFKRDQNGQFWFLEVNPSGQWLWVEFEGHYPISEAFARYLTLGPGAEFETQEQPMTYAAAKDFLPEGREEVVARLKAS